MAELVAICSGIFSVPLINDCIVTPLKNHISYSFTLDSKLQRLRKLVEDLKNKTQEMQHSVREAERNGEQIYEKVDTWLSSVQKDIEEADELLRGDEEAKKKCCSGFCPNLKTRYKLSKKAHKKVLAINEQLQNAQGLNPISFRPPPQPIVEPSMYSHEALPSRVLILNRIMDALKDPNLNMIGVYGMGGVGKTTLAKEVLRQAVKQKLFETVVLVAVSQTPELRRIQGEIADALGLKFDAEEVPGRASRLQKRLNKAKVLIILDDVWQKLDLYAIGISVGDGCESCKILLTSRRKEVLSSEMCTQKEFPLNVLEEEEAWRLFEMSVSMVNNLELRALATEVAKKCAGLPLLIKKVATDLRNKDAYAWKDMLTQLSNSENTEIYEKVHRVIESSYEKLIDEEAKSLFLLCALFGSSNIRIRDLLIYCIGLSLFKHMNSIEGSRNRVLTLIDKLKNESLLLDGDKAGFVKIHDVVRDIAIAIAARVHYAFVGKGQIRTTDLESKNYKRISLPFCEIPKLPEVLQCPEAEMFSIFTEYSSLDIPALFFEGATKLKVLHFTGVSFMSDLPSSICFLTGLQTLSLDRCWGLINVAMVAELKQLEVLSFAGSDIAELPTEIKALTQLKLLDLTGCYLLRVIPSNVLSKLRSLEELYMLNTSISWGTEGDASLVELKNLSRLKTLEIEVKDDKLLPEDWFFDGIQNYIITVGYRWSRYDDVEEGLRILMLDLRSIGLMDRIKEFMGGAEVLYLGKAIGIENLLCDSSRDHKINSFQRLRVLKIHNNNSWREVLPFSSEKCLPHLEEMEVKLCLNIEAIVGEGNEDEVMELAQLTSLKLTSLPNLRGICRTGGTVVSFHSLTSLEIERCTSLKYVFTTSMVKSLKQLKKLEIIECELIKEIILVTKCEEVVEFPQLKELQIRDCYSLKNFVSKDCSSLKNFVNKDSDRSNYNESTDDEYFFNELVTLPNLEIMNINRMGDFRYLWNQQFADNKSFSKLKSLEISNCEKLSAVFPSNEYRRFERLESLDVSDCNAVKEIYEYEGIGYDETNALQPFALQQVLIQSLPSLKHIWSKHIDEAFSFKNLQSVIVNYCPELKYVIPASIACGLLQLQELKILYCGVEMIITESKNEGSEGASTRIFEWPKLESLKILDCNKLIRFGFIISKETQDSVYFIQKIIPNVKDLELNHHSLKAIQNDDHRFPEDQVLWKLELVSLFDLEEESTPFLFDFLRRIFSVENLYITASCWGETFALCHLITAVKRLHLLEVSKLKHIVKEDTQLSSFFQFLQTLIVEQCNDMVNIAPSSVSFINLTTLHVENCEKMTSLVTASTAKSMIQLEELEVYDCRLMEDIIVANNYDRDCTEEHDDDGDCTKEHGDDDDDDVITFHKLKLLELRRLPNLNSFCSAKYNFNFPLLEKVSIDDCKRMKTFCGGAVHTPKLQCQGNLNGIMAQQDDGRVKIP